MQKFCSDVLVVGGGIIGTTIARQLAKTNPKLRINLIEKETDFGQHTSKHNSGVLHGGLYYKTDSRKARHCVRGNMLLTQYHKDHNIALVECGKIISAKNDQEFESLKALQSQATQNGVKVDLISQSEALKLEPRLKLHKDYPLLFCPSTKAGDPQAVLGQLVKDLNQCSNVSLHSSTKYKKILKNEQNNIAIKTSEGNVFESRILVNCAGLYADRIAKDFGVAQQLSLIPLKGLYLKDSASVGKFRTLVYPVPPVKGSMFLGVHTTITKSGDLKLGPTAVPAFWRENYRGLDNFEINELLEVLKEYLKIGLSTKSLYYIKLFIQEMRRHNKSRIVSDAQQLVNLCEDGNTNSLIPKDVIENRFEFGQPAIRSQLIDATTKEFLSDFLVEEHMSTLHLLNMVSPGWTSSLSLAEEVSDRVEQLLQVQ